MFELISFSYRLGLTSFEHKAYNEIKSSGQTKGHGKYASLQEVPLTFLTIIKSQKKEAQR